MSMGGLGGAAPTGFNAMNLGKEGPLKAPKLPGQQMPGVRTNSQGMFNPTQTMGPVAPQGMAGAGSQFGKPMNQATSASQARYNSGMRW